MYLHVRRCCISQSRIVRCDKWDCPVSRVHYAHDWSCSFHIALLSIDGRGLHGWRLGLYRALDGLTGHDRLRNYSPSASVANLKLKLCANNSHEMTTSSRSHSYVRVEFTDNLHRSSGDGIEGIAIGQGAIFDG